MNMYMVFERKKVLRSSVWMAELSHSWYPTYVCACGANAYDAHDAQDRPTEVDGHAIGTAPHEHECHVEHAEQLEPEVRHERPGMRVRGPAQRDEGEHYENVGWVAYSR